MFSYDDAKFGVIERKWFGLHLNKGGAVAAASGFTCGAEAATSNNHVDRYYFRGPVRLKKFGVMVQKAVACTATDMDKVPFRLRVNGGNETSNVTIADGAAAYTVASTTTFTNDLVNNASYIDIIQGTPLSGDNTEVVTATVTGTFAYFVDYTRNFQDGTGDVTSEWDR
jgi:hypothetical protein